MLAGSSLSRSVLPIARRVLWSVPREWEGDTAFLLGGGPSLRGFDASVLDGRRCIVVNNSWELVPDADVLFFADKKWWMKHGPAVKAGFRGKYIATISDAQDEALLHLSHTRKPGLETDPTSVRHGGSGGYMSINVAFHFGVSRIVLLGYDLRTDGEHTHWHEGHGHAPGVQAHRLNKVMLPHFQKLVEPLAAAGVEVINATPGSALTCWPFRPLTEFL
jgi:hypothetical protein